MLKSKPGEIIRHKKTREPYLILDMSALGFIVVNLLLRDDPALVQVILPRAQDSFEPDIEMTDMSKEEAEVIESKLPIIESIHETLFDEEN